MIAYRSNARMWLALCFVAVVQSAALAKIVIDRQNLLRSGREITIKVQPVDPRDIFRGDYVTLGFGLSPLDSTLITDANDRQRISAGATVFVTLVPEPDNRWKPVAVGTSYPADPGPDRVVLKGLVGHRWQDAAQANVHKFDIRFGIESYFVPEGTGMALEHSLREASVDAIVSVGSDGRAAMKGLIVGGERRVDPPLY